VKRNLSERGRVRAMHEVAERESPHAAAYQPEPSLPEPVSPPETAVAAPVSEPDSQPASEPEIQPELRLADPAGDRAGPGEPQTPKAGVAEAFEHALPFERGSSSAERDRARVTRPRDRRLTGSRVTEIREELAEVRGELVARIEALEQRPDAGEVLAEELGSAALRTLRRQPPKKGPAL